MFIESICTKILQAKGNMLLPMYAQIIGAIINIILNPIFIFGGLGIEALGIKGSAYSTVIGQWVTMIIVLYSVIHTYSIKGKVSKRICLQIYKTGIASIIMQSLYTLYIFGLNMILKQFTESAVAVLGIYYKLQTFFFIPLMGLQQVIMPIFSFNYGAKMHKRVDDILKYSIFISVIVMMIGMIIFMTIPKQLLLIFSNEDDVIQIGCYALRVISSSFIPAAIFMIFSVYFQGINMGKSSVFITVLRQVVLLVPLAWIFKFKGLEYVWFTFPVTELIVSLFCLIIYYKKLYISKINYRIKINNF